MNWKLTGRGVTYESSFDRNWQSTVTESTKQWYGLGQSSQVSCAACTLDLHELQQQSVVQQRLLLLKAQHIF